MGKSAERAVLYCRLSEEDTQKRDPLAESESIQNQKSMLLAYAFSQGWEISGIYCDEDYSGVDAARPEWNQLLADAQAGKFDIVLCKAQSRFTRDMEMVEKYLHHSFPEWGIRFVAVVDHVDTDDRGGKKARQINGLINEWYLEDLSENVRSVLDDKRRRGRFIGSFEPFGYQKNDRDHGALLVDETAAEIVRRIFSLRLSGYGCLAIARLLNEENVLTPTDYKIANGRPYKPIPNYSHLWRDDTVREILTRETYTGCMVQGKTRKVSYKSERCRTVPQENWIVVPDMHPAIISREQFDRVQELLHSNLHPTTGKQTAHPLAGKLRCVFCGGAMHRARAKGISYLRCRAGYRYHSGCSTHSVRLDEVEDAILERLRAHCQAYFNSTDFHNRIAVRCKAKEELDRCGARIEHCKAELEKKSVLLSALYADKVSGEITPEEFNEFRHRFSAERNVLIAELEQLQTQLLEMKEEDEKLSSVMEKAEAYRNPRSLTQELADELITQVEIGVTVTADAEKQTQIRIHWRF